MDSSEFVFRAFLYKGMNIRAVFDLLVLVKTISFDPFLLPIEFSLVITTEGGR